MATGDEFRYAAAAVADLAELIGEVAKLVLGARGEVGIDGGTIADAVDLALSQIGGDIGTVVGTCTGIGEAMADRADRCDAFTREVEDYLDRKRAYDEMIRMNIVPFGPRPVRPQPSEPWMEASL